MEFECKFAGNEMFFVCVDKEKHGDVPMRAEVILRKTKMKFARDRKRPEVKIAYLAMMRCPICKRYAEYQFTDVVIE